MDAGRKGARQSVVHSSHPSSESDILARALNLSWRCSLGKEHQRTSAGIVLSTWAERETNTMLIGCWTSSKIRVFTSGWCPSGAVNDPDAVAGAAQVIAHPLKARAVEEPRYSNETNDSSLASWSVVKYLPGGPTPKVYVQIAQVFYMCANAPLCGRHPVSQRRLTLDSSPPSFDPSALAHGFFFIGRIADNNRD